MMEKDPEKNFEVVWDSFESAVEWIIFGFQAFILFFTQCRLL